MSEPLVFDQGSLQFGKCDTGELHVHLYALMQVAARRLNGKVRFIQANANALTIMQSAAHRMCPRPRFILDYTTQHAEPNEIGLWEGIPLVVDGYARDEHAVVLFGTNGDVETIAIRNYRF